jgi:hypothetical protein
VAQEPASGHDGACMVGHSERHIQNLTCCGGGQRQRAIHGVTFRPHADNSSEMNT